MGAHLHQRLPLRRRCDGQHSVHGVFEVRASLLFLQTRATPASAAGTPPAVSRARTAARRWMPTFGALTTSSGVHPLSSALLQAHQALARLPSACVCVCRRMDFSIRCAYAHGTSALRTHLINMVPKQLELTWPAFNKLRTKWKGRVRPACPLYSDRRPQSQTPVLSTCAH